MMAVNPTIWERGGDRTSWIPGSRPNINPFPQGDPGKDLNPREQMVVITTGIS